MPEIDLLTECKIGLGLPVEEHAFNSVLRQKITAVKTFLRRAGVSDEALDSEDAVGVIVMGVGDIWSQDAGAVKFSPVFISMASQLALGG